MPILFVKRLTVIDNSILSPSRGLVGESWHVDIELQGDLDAQGMVLDFGRVKHDIKRLIDERFDHKLLVPADNPKLQISDYGDGLHLAFSTDDGRLVEHRSPHEAVTLIPCQRIVADRLSHTIADYLSRRTPTHVDGVRVHLHPEPIDGAFYHYSHGLKHHDGNCQRIAHGHRSRIEIFRNGKRDRALEDAWAARWSDAYIATRDDLIGTSQRDGEPYNEFGYRSSQGDFGLTLPRSACYIIDTDSTIENIAQHIARQLKQNHPDDRFRVCAFEGVDKGAIGVA